jgi:hypothetical protein
MLHSMLQELPPTVLAETIVRSHFFPTNIAKKTTLYLFSLRLWVAIGRMLFLFLS